MTNDIPNRREIPEYLLGKVEDKVAAVNRKAIKLGVEGFKLSIVRRFDKPSTQHHGVTYPYLEVEVIGPKVEIPGGWVLDGKVDFEEGLTIVSARPGIELPVTYRNADTHCDHCNTDRPRNSIYVFSLDGKYKQVGRSCLKDFIGYDPARVLWAAREFSGIFDELDDDERGEGQGEPMVGVLDVLIAASFVIEKHGFVSRKMVQEGFEGDTTAGRVDGYLFDRKERKEYKPTEADREKAAKVLTWVQSWSALADPSDYQYNAVELCSAERVRLRRIGLLVSLVASWNRENEERVTREKLVNKHVGQVGQRREFKTKYLGENSFDTDWGLMTVGRFASDEGMLVYKGTAPFWPRLEAGDDAVFEGTIKKHDDYKDMCQTMVSRCSWGPKPVKVKKKARAVRA